MHTVKEIAALTGLTKHAIRFYTDQGLIPGLKRDRNNHRLFNDEAVNWLTVIKCFRSCGMSVEAIKEFVALCLEEKPTFEKRYQILLEQEAIAERNLREAQTTLDYVRRKVAYYKEILANRRPDDTNPVTWKAATAPASGRGDCLSDSGREQNKAAIEKAFKICRK